MKKPTLPVVSLANLPLASGVAVLVPCTSLPAPARPRAEPPEGVSYVRSSPPRLVRIAAESALALAGAELSLTGCELRYFRPAFDASEARRAVRQRPSDDLLAFCDLRAKHIWLNHWERSPCDVAQSAAHEAHHLSRNAVRDRAADEAAASAYMASFWQRHGGRIKQTLMGAGWRP